MYFTVTFNGIHYQTEVELQIALDYLKFRAYREQAAGKKWTAALVSAETGEIVYETSSNT